MSDSESSTSSLNDLPPMDFPASEQPPPEEHLWIGTMSEDEKILKFEGCDDSDANLILKRATLDAECEDESRHIVQVISLDHADERIVGTLCALSLNSNGGSIALDNLVINPPTAFKLIQGKGPLTISANLMKDNFLTASQVDEEESLEEIEDGEEVSDGSDGSESSVEDDVGGTEGDVDTNDLYDSTDLDGVTQATDRLNDLSTSSEEEEETETSTTQEPQPKKPRKQLSPPKKRKAEENNAPKKEKESAAKPPNSKKAAIKSKIESQNAKSKENKSEKAPITDAKSLIAVIKAYKGGKPTKKNKFENWVKNQFKVQEKKWVEEAWKVVQEGK